MARGRWFALAVALQIVFLLGMAGRHQYTVVTGTPMLLKTAPVDPRDPFRGDYVRLSYAAQQVPFPGTPTGKFNHGDQLWVTFQAPAAGSKYWYPVAASSERPTVAADQVAVRARLLWFDTGLLRVEYGFEQFFVPEGQGRDLERDFERLDVAVAVDRFGRAALRQVLFDDKPIEWK